MVKNLGPEDFPAGPVVTLCPLMQPAWVQSLVGELISYMPSGESPKKHKTETCNKYNNDFKNGPPKTSLKKQNNLLL